MLAAQTPFDLSHEVFRQSQVIKGLLKGFGGVLRLAVITCEALLRCAATTLSGFSVAFLIGFGTNHSVLLQGLSLLCGVPCGSLGP